MPAILAGAYFAGREIYLSDTKGDVDALSKDELLKEIETEKAKFIGFGKYGTYEHFKIHESLEHIDKRIYLIFLRRMNFFLKKFPSLKHKMSLVCTYRGKTVILRDDITFQIGCFSDIDSSSIREGLKEMGAVACYEGYGIFVNDFCAKHYKFSKCLGKFRINSGYNTPLPVNKIIEGAIDHEIGHMIQSIYFGNHVRKENILEFAKQNINSNIDEYISNYGSSNDNEWFAEVFANAYSGDATTELGRAMHDFIENHIQNDKGEPVKFDEEIGKYLDENRRWIQDGEVLRF